VADEASNADSDDDLADSGLEVVPAPSIRFRRAAVSAEALNPEESADWKPPVFEKSPEERRQLSEIIRTSPDSKLQIMFGAIDAETFHSVIDAMYLRAIAQGEKVIEEGDVGKEFFIVKSGHFDIFKRNKDSAEGGDVKVFEAGAGFAFGEIALLYNAPRTATVSATLPSEVWCLGRQSFRNLVVSSSEKQFQEYVEFLRGCEILAELSNAEVATLAEVCQEEEFEEDEAILEQGDKDSMMYIVRRGAAVACIRGDRGEVEVMQYKRGDVFGEIALLTGEPRKASVYAIGQTCCMCISREAFNRTLGPIHAILSRNIDKYQKYQDAIAQGSAHREHEVPDDLLSHQEADADADKSAVEVFEGGAGRQARKAHRKREPRDSAVAIDATAQAEAACAGPAVEGAAAGEEPKEPGGLKEKIAEDFRNPALVAPDEALAPAGCQLQVYGGLRLGEKFTADKTLLVRTQVDAAREELEETFAWRAPVVPFKDGITRIAVLCQKGQKAPSDPTPNQDNYFCFFVGSVQVCGVCDGHGPFGHLVSFRLVQTLPHFLTTSEHFGKDWPRAMKEAFLSAQADLVSFAQVHDINIDASGAAGTCLAFDGPRIHIAWIGDSGAMVASWNRRDSRLVFGTKDHKPELPEERERLEAAGSEVREVDEGSHRIYIRGTNFPGLTMSRAFGDTACAGVLQEPEYKEILCQPSDEYYAVIASDGIWEFIEYEQAVELSAKKLRLKGPRETVRFLVEASRKRWAYCCGDYCDDITAILVQWNYNDKEATHTTNHTLTARRHE